MTGRIVLAVLALGGFGIAGSSWIADPKAFAYAWLTAAAFFASWPLGSMALIFIHALTGGRWGMVIGRELRAAALLMPVAMLTMILVILTAHRLYPWLDAQITLGNAFYLNASFQTVRLAIYAVFWLALWGTIIAFGSRRPDLLRMLAPPGLMLLALTVTFAAIDGTEALEPQFNSSVYGMIVLAGMTLFALAAAVVFRVANAVPDPMRIDLSRLLLGMTVLWGYLEFVQLLIVWETNLPHEIAWYLKRSTHFWTVGSAIIGTGHFALPFFMLLSRKAQRRPGVVITVAGLSASMEALRWAWIVLPEAGTPSFALIGVTAASVVGLGALSTLIFAIIRDRLGEIVYEVPAEALARHG